MSKQKRNNYRKPNSDRKPQNKKGYGDKSVERNYEFGARDVHDELNDYTWYVPNDQTLKDTASYSFNAAIGAPIDISGGVSIANNFTIPGIMAINVTMVPGVSKDSQSALNIAANNFYTFVRANNSGSKNYEAQDLIIYLLSLDSIYSCLSHCGRAYQTLLTFDQYNRYFPDAFLRVMGFDPVDFRLHIADYRALINRMILKVAVYNAPKKFPLYLRHMHIFSEIYADGGSNKPGSYLFVPNGFYKFEPVAEITGGKLSFKPWGSYADPLTFAEVSAYLEDLISAVTLEEDSAIISGDILKAYGEGDLVKLNMLGEVAMIKPIYNIEMLSQIQNATLVGDVSNVDVTQDAERLLVCQPQISWNVAASDGASKLNTNRILNLYSNSPEPKEVMVATRLMVGGGVVKLPGAGIAALQLNNCGSEIATTATIVDYVDDGTGKWILNEDPSSYQYINYITTDYSDEQINTITKLSKFVFHPYMVFFRNAEGTTPVAANILSGFVGDVENYTLLTNQDLQKLQDTAVLGEFAIPVQSR